MGQIPTDISCYRFVEEKEVDLSTLAEYLVYTFKGIQIISQLLYVTDWA